MDETKEKAKKFLEQIRDDEVDPEVDKETSKILDNVTRSTRDRFVARVMKNGYIRVPHYSDIKYGDYLLVKKIDIDDGKPTRRELKKRIIELEEEIARFRHKLVELEEYWMPNPS